MLLVSFIFSLIIFNLFSVVTDKSTPYYKDIRFWLIVISLVVLVVMTVEGYPIQ
ncbi:MAG: hypothetical protein AAF573_17470 [Bacteroidota bacterium]